jgi:GNAT superfamily N-acetyltransferase
MVGSAVLPEIPAALTRRGIAMHLRSGDSTPFLTHLFIQTRWQELANAGWTDPQKIAFLTQQFGFQDLHYTRHYAGAASGIITQYGEPIGRLLLFAMPGELRIVDIALLPTHCNQGIGAALLEAVLGQARRRNDAVTIHVEALNPAHRLYTRLGFTDIGGNEIHRKMAWRCAAGATGNLQLNTAS